MTSRLLQETAYVLLVCAITMVPSTDALAVDATFLAVPYKNNDAQGRNSAAPYDIEYAAAAIELRAAPNTPEADALPGEFFFMEGARAVLKKEYAFAIQMYQAAASWAYKPAEYNLGVMYSRGQGVPVDLPRALAWMALAAERNERHYVDAREAIYAEMTKEQFDQANAIWRDLKLHYADAVALRRAKARWAEVRSRVTGSHVGAVGNLVVTGPSGNRGNASNPWNPEFDPHFKDIEQKEREARFSNPNFKGNSFNPTGGVTTPGELTGGHGVDGSIAYGRLQQSDDPYDPRFKNAIGTANVGPPKPVTAQAPAETRDADAERPEQH
jgi:hypothetical protein